MCLLFWKKKKKQVAVSKPEIKEEKDEVMNFETIVVEEVPAEVVQKDKKVQVQKYHVSQNKDKEAVNYMMWRVRKSGSDKTIQYFDTQKLAIEFAQDLADRAGSTVVIHKLDGSIRKQDYTK
ncbi:MAG: DUF2188 domain-containing protein [Acholeplasmataceae bacterium]|nr:DUF2188 domain-containing protein [Acholeplasmataceae bacterium]